jgi:hypothetical protein
MPLRDYFRPPVDDQMSWESFHGAWPTVIVMALGRRLPRRYVAAPRIHFGSSVEIDVATFDKDEPAALSWGEGEANGGGVATAIWAPPQPTLAVAADLPAQDVYEVRVWDTKRGRRLVAAVAIVSPANKDRPEHRQAFVAKCAALLEEKVSVVIVDLVTTRHFNLYRDLLTLIDRSDPALSSEPPPVYAVACRFTKKDRTWQLETWLHPLVLGQPLPTLPLWLADDLAVPLELEGSYEETCRILRID